MIETIPSISPERSAVTALRARLASAAVTLARQRAEKEVKLAIQREGRRKLSQIARREIVALLSRGASRADRRGEADY